MIRVLFVSPWTSLIPTLAIRVAPPQGEGVSNSIVNYQINQYKTFQLILPVYSHLMRSFVNSIIPKVSHRPLCCVFTEVDFEK